MWRWIIPTMLTIGLVGCNLPNEQKIQARDRWQKTRASAMASVGAEQLKSGELDKAQTQVRQALRLSQECLTARIVLAKVLIEKGQYAEAAKELEEADRQVPRNPEVAYLWGVALEKRGELDQALQQYEKAQSLDDSNNAYVTAAAEVLAAKGQVVQALEVLETRMARSDSDDSMLALAAELAMLANRPQRAAELYQRCLDASPKSMAQREGLAKAQFFARDYAAALEALDRLTAHADYRDKVSWPYIMSGDCHMAMGRPLDARGAYELACQIDPGEVGAWLCLARCGLASGDVARAETACRRAQALAPTSADAAVLLGLSLLRQNKSDKAAEAARAGLKHHADEPALLCLLGRALWASGQADQAADCYRQALQREPENALAKALLAKLECE